MRSARLRFAIATLVVVATAGAWRARESGAFVAGPDRAVASLVRAIGARRVVEGRLTGGFAHGPLAVPRRAESGTGEWVVLAAAAEARARAEREPSLDNRRAVAAAHLLTGDPASAVATLEAVVRDRADARALSDLAAARLANAVAGPAEDLPRALDAASRARQLDPGLAEAAFNRALALEKLNLDEQAAREWSTLLELEPAASGWAADARRRLAAMQRGRPELDNWRSELAARVGSGDATALDRLVQRSPEGARQFLETELLPTLGDNEDALVRVRTLASSLRRVAGERASEDAVNQLAGQATGELLHATRDYGRARRQYDAADWAGARARLERTLPMLIRHRSGLVGPALTTTSALAFQAGQIGDARTLATRALAAAERAGGRLAAARAAFMLGLIDFTDGRFAAAIARYERAAAEYDAAGEPGWAAYAREQVAEVWGDLGRKDWGWKERVELLRVLDRFTDPLRRITMVSLVGDACLDAGWPEAAVAFQQEALAMARRSGNDGQVATTTLALARASQAAPARAIAHFETAGRLIEALADPLLRERLRGEHRRAFAEVMPLESRPARARVDEAIRWLAGRGDDSRAAQLELRRALADQAAGAAAAAEAGFERVVAALAALPAPDRELGASYAALAITALDGLLEVRQAVAPEQALALAEARWRAALGGGLAVDRARLRAVVEAIAPDAAVLGLVPTPRALLLFVITRGEVSLRRVEVGREDLALAIAATSDLLQRVEAPTADVGQAVMRAVWDPVAAELVGKRRIYTVATGPIAQLPLPSLVSLRLGPRAPAFFFVPSVSALASRAPARVAARAGLFAVSAAGRLPGLRPLPEAAAEVRAVVDAHGGGRVLHDPEVAAFRLGLRTAHRLHFAGHAVENRQSPARSALVLGDAILSSREVEAMDLRGLELVTLAACSSARSRAAFGEGSLTLANSFLAAGASAVVGTLWDVSDRTSPSLVQLYATLGRGVPLQDALGAFARAQHEAGAPDARALVVYTALGATQAAAELDHAAKGRPR